MPTPHQLAEARRRLELIEALGRYPSLRKAAEALGESVANLCRYRQAYEAGGRTLEALLPGTDRAGRPPAAATLLADEIAEARRALFKTESLPLALEHLADSDLCSHATREILLRYRDSRDYPPSIVRAVRFTEEEWAALRGKKSEQGSAYTTRRGMFVIEPDGSRRELFAGDIVEADDVSTDVPYFVTLPDGTVRVGRQILVYRDVRSRKYLYAAAIARTQDSYRAEDIVRATRWLVEAHGLPGRFRFERGSWASAAIDGHDCPVTGAKWGGIAQLIPVTHAYSSNGKTIEGGFRLFHQVMGLHGVRTGKTRGEYEQPSADMLAVNAGRKDAAACGFIPWERVLKALEDTFTKINGRATWDRHTATHTTPDDLWWSDMQARPGKRLPVCPPELFDHFLPVKRQVAVGAVQGGHVQVSLSDYPAPFVFRVSGYDAEGKELPYLERTHKVWVAFDPHEVAATGAVIYNAESSDSPRNRGGYRPLERLFTAALATDRPQIDLRPSGERGADADIAAKKVRTAQVRAAGTSIGLFGQGARRVRHQSDAQGNVSRVESGAAPRSPAPAAQAPRTAPAKPVRAPSVAVYEDLDATPELPPTREVTAAETRDWQSGQSRHSQRIHFADTTSARTAAPAVQYEEI